MFKEMKEIAVRNADTLIEDMIGVASIFTLLVIGLHLPGLV